MQNKTEQRRHRESPWMVTQVPAQLDGAERGRRSFRKRCGQRARGKDEIAGIHGCKTKLNSVATVSLPGW